MDYREYEHHPHKYETREKWLFQPQEHSKTRVISCKSLVSFIVSFENNPQISRSENTLFCDSPPNDSIQMAALTRLQS